MFGYDSYDTRVTVCSDHLGCRAFYLGDHSSPGTINTKLFHYPSLAFYVVSLTAANANLCATRGCTLQNPSQASPAVPAEGTHVSRLHPEEHPAQGAPH